MYEKDLEVLKSRHQLQLACIDRRLDACQEAFRLFFALNLSLKDTVRAKSGAEEMETFYRANCLFLDPDPREKFRYAINIFLPEVWDVEHGSPAGDNMQHVKALSEVRAAIVTAAGLPLINGDGV